LDAESVATAEEKRGELMFLPEVKTDRALHYYNSEPVHCKGDS
jgi:hypothetical protein